MKLPEEVCSRLFNDTCAPRNTANTTKMTERDEAIVRDCANAAEETICGEYEGVDYYGENAAAVILQRYGLKEK